MQLVHDFNAIYNQYDIMWYRLILQKLICYNNSLLKKISLLTVVLISCLFLWSCSVTRETDTIRVSARLVRVVSGQTIEVILPESDRPQRVRIIGIDAPKLDDTSWSERVQTRLKELLKSDRAFFAALRASLTLEIENDEPDRYNRILAHVWQK